MFTLSASIALLALAGSALADPAPLTPGPTNEGAPCVISWSPDTTGEWTKTNIQLMTGQNQQMLHITTVVTDLDTTDAAPTSYTWTCPDVDTNAAIYWYQFSHAEDPTNLVWTTRWAIASSTGVVNPPEHATQPDGSAIGWGIGKLTNMALAKPAPAYITGEGNVADAAGTTGTATGTGSTSLAPTSSAPASSSVPTSSRITTSAVRSSTTSAAPSPTTSNSAAGRSQSHGAVFALGAAAVGAFLFA